MGSLVGTFLGTSLGRITHPFPGEITRLPSAAEVPGRLGRSEPTAFMYLTVRRRPPDATV